MRIRFCLVWVMLLLTGCAFHDKSPLLVTAVEQDDFGWSVTLNDQLIIRGLSTQKSAGHPKFHLPRLRDWRGESRDVIHLMTWRLYDHIHDALFKEKTSKGSSFPSYNWSDPKIKGVSSRSMTVSLIFENALSIDVKVKHFESGWKVIYPHFSSPHQNTAMVGFKNETFQKKVEKDLIWVCQRQLSEKQHV